MKSKYIFMNSFSIKSFWARFVACILICISLANNINATHIVGGDITYECLGNDLYEITLTVRRDCINGLPNADFDDPVSIGIFDPVFGNLLNQYGTFGELLIPFANSDTLDLTITSDCGFVGSQVCVQQATYKKTVKLAFRNRGFLLAYQRCCRNVTLNNIVEPLETGSTYFVEITEEALNSCNSSPVFNNWGDIYICANMDLDFDHSATDAEGDSLVYSLCTPTTGATVDDPQPQPPAKPPYDEVVFQSPFSVDDMMGGVPLTIDANTGRLSAVPGLIGQFLIGVKVEEYRNGELLSVVKRDFEYNVRVCSEGPIAAFDSPDVLCDDFTTTFDNNSSDADSYTWYFNYPSTDSTFVSNEENPTFTFPIAGQYEVRLEAKRALDGCFTSFSKVITVSDGSISSSFDVNVSSCNNTDVELNLVAQATDSNPSNSIVSYEWTITQGVNVVNLNGVSVSVDVDHANEINIALVVTSSSGCTEEIIQTVQAEDYLATPSFTAELSSCDNDGFVIIFTDTTVGLNAQANAWSWTIQEGANTFTSNDNPYQLTLQDIASVDVSLVVGLDNGCSVSTSEVITMMGGAPTVDFELSLVSCQNDGYFISLQDNSNHDTFIPNSFNWTITYQNGMEDLYNGADVQAYVENGSVIDITLAVNYDNLCVLTATQNNINVDDIIDATVLDLSSGDCNTNGAQTLNLTAIVDNEYTLVSHTFEVSVNGAAPLSASGLTYTLVANTGDVLEVTSTATYNNGCSKTTTQAYNVEGVSITFLSDPIAVCQGTSSLLVANPNTDWTYIWSPISGLDFSNTTNQANPIFTGTESTSYSVTVSNGVCDATATVSVEVIDEYDLMITGENVTCDGSVELVVSGAGINDNYIWSLNADFTDILAIGSSLSTTQIEESITYYVTTDGNGLCNSEIESFTVVYSALETDFTPLFTACSGDVFIYTVSLGTDIASIQWDTDSHITSGAATSSPVITIGANETDGFTLSFTATSTAGCENSYDVEFEISTAPTLSFVASQECGTTIVCFDNTSSTISADQMWDFGDGSAAIVAQDTCYDFGAFGMYDVRLFSDAQVCGGEAVTQLVNVNESSLLMIVGDTLSCDGIVELSVSGAPVGSMYEWSTDAAFSNIIATGEVLNTTLISTSQTYFVQTVGSVGCNGSMSSIHVQDGFFDLDFSTPLSICIGDEVAYNIFPDPNIMETILFEAHPNIVGDLNTTTPIISVPVGQTGSFTITFTATSVLGCTKTMDVMFNIVDNPIASFDAMVDCMSTTVCFTNTTPISGGDFVWDFGDGSPQVFVNDTCYTYAQEGSYHVSLANFGSPCQAITNVQVIDVYNDANLNIYGATMICNGVVSLGVTGVNSNGSFIWASDPDFNNILGTGNLLNTPMVGDTYTIYASTDENASCSGLDSITVVAEEFIVDFDTPITVCQGDEFVYTVSSNYPDVHYVWTNSPYVIDNGDTASPTISIPTDQVEDIVLSFTACTVMGCILNLEVTLEVIQAPKLSYNYEQICGTSTVCFDNTSVIIDDSQIWNFGDGFPLVTGLDTCYTFDNYGTYTVSLFSDNTICGGITSVQTINVNQSVLLTALGDTISCDGIVDLAVSGAATAGVDYEWSTDPDFNVIVGTGAVLNTTLIGSGQTFYVQVMNNDQCLSNIDSIRVQDGFFDLDFSTPLNICQGDNLEYLVIPDPSIMTSILWEAHPNIEGPLDVFNPNIVVPISQTGSFNLTFTAMSVVGCTKTMDVMFNIVDNPVASFTYPPNDCSNTTVCFTNTTPAASGFFIWNFGDGSPEVVAQSTEICYTFPANDSYQVSLSNIADVCQASTTTQTVNVFNELQLDITGEIMICNGEINLAVTGALPGDSYIWSTSPNFNTIIATGDTYSGLLAPNVDSLTIYVSTDANAVCAGTSEITVYNDMFDIVFVSPFEACAGDQISYPVVSNDPTVEFVWDASPFIISGGNTGNPTIAVPVDQVDPIELSFTASNGAGCIMDTVAIINVVDRPILDFDYDLECGTLEVCFTAQPAGLNIYFWQFGEGGFPVTGAEVCHTYTSEGIYNVTLSTIGAFCQAAPISIPINVQLLDTVSITGDLYSCDGNTNLMANGAGANDGFLWSTSPTMDPIISTTNPLVYPMSQDTQVFYVTTDTMASCQGDIVAFEVIDASIDLSFMDTLTVCAGQSVQMNVINNKPQFVTMVMWADDPHILGNGNTFVPIIAVGADETGEFTLSFTVTNEAGCEETYDVLFVISSELNMDFAVTLDECGTYTMCFENTNMNSNVTYFWDFGDLSTELDTTSMFDPGCYTYPAAGTYQVSLMADSDGCGMMQLIKDVIVPESVELQVSTLSSTVCADDAFTIQSTATGDAVITYCLENGEVLGEGAELIVNFSTDTTVLVKALDSFGCTDTVSVLVDIFDFDLIPNGPQVVVCAGDEFEISVINLDENGNYTYQWSPVDCIVSGGDTANPIISAEESKIMTVVVTNTDLGCTTSMDIPVDVSTVDATIFPDIFGVIKAGVEVELTASGGGDNAFYEWSNDNTINTQSQIVSPLETTTYVVTVTDEFACSGTAEYVLEVREALCNEEDVFVPSAFTPNNDGINDVLYVRSAVIEDLEFTVVDRWGKQLFISRNVNVGWDGTFNGENLTPDVYAYCIKATCINQETYVKSGNVSLLK